MPHAYAVVLNRHGSLRPVPPPLPLPGQALERHLSGKAEGVTEEVQVLLKAHGEGSVPIHPCSTTGVPGPLHAPAML